MCRIIIRCRTKQAKSKASLLNLQPSDSDPGLAECMGDRGDQMETANRTTRQDRLYTISSDWGDGGDWGDYKETRPSRAALIRGRHLFKHCTRQLYFFYIFIQRYTFYLLIFLWTDTKLIVNLKLREKFTR